MLDDLHRAALAAGYDFMPLPAGMAASARRTKPLPPIDLPRWILWRFRKRFNRPDYGCRRFRLIKTVRPYVPIRGTA